MAMSGHPRPEQPSSTSRLSVGERAPAMALSPSTVSRGLYVMVREERAGAPRSTEARPASERRYAPCVRVRGVGLGLGVGVGVGVGLGLG